MREITCANIKVLWLFAKVLSAKFGSVAFFGGSSEQSAKIYFLPVCGSFLPQKFHYMVLTSGGQQVNDTRFYRSERSTVLHGCPSEICVVGLIVCKPSIHVREILFLPSSY